MIEKFIKNYAILLALSVLGNYALAVGYPALNESEVSFAEILYWSAIILLIPFLLGLVIAISYRLVRRVNYKYYWQLVWVLWVVIYITPFMFMHTLQGRIL